MAAPDDPFEAARRHYVPIIEQISQTGDQDVRAEEELAGVLDSIREDSVRHLTSIDDQANSGESLLTAVNAWASLASYATMRFYLEGPQSARKNGGFSEKVADRLLSAADAWRPFLKRAVKTMRASSFTVSVGLPLGISIGLTWDTSDLADTVREAAASVRRTVGK